MDNKDLKIIEDQESDAKFKRMKVFTVTKRDATTIFKTSEDYGNNGQIQNQRQAEEDEGSESDGYSNMTDIYTSKLIQNNHKPINHRSGSLPHSQLKLSSESNQPLEKAGLMAYNNVENREKSQLIIERMKSKESVFEMNKKLITKLLKLPS